MAKKCTHTIQLLRAKIGSPCVRMTLRFAGAPFFSFCHSLALRKGECVMKEFWNRSWKESKRIFHLSL